MRPSFPVALLLLALVPGTSIAEEGPSSERPTTLLEAAQACPRSLSQAMERTYGTDRRPVRAELVLDTAGGLLARAVVRVVEDEQVSFEEWLGPLGGGGWIPMARAMTDAVEVAKAAAQWKLLESERNLLRKTLAAAIRTEEHAGPADIVLAIGPVSGRRGPAVSRRAAHDGELRGLRFEPASSAFEVVAPDPAPQRISPTVRVFPEFEVPSGRWFTTPSAPTLAKLRGRPVLVVLTDPG